VTSELEFPDLLRLIDERSRAFRSAVVDYAATEGRSGRLWVSADGARTRPRAQAAGPVDARVTGTASEIVLDRLIAWEPE